MTTSYPTALDSFTNPTVTDNLGSPSHPTQHTDENGAIAALEAKIGIGASTPLVAGYVLTVTASGSTAWMAPPPIGPVSGYPADSLIIADTTSPPALPNYLASVTDPYFGTHDLRIDSPSDTAGKIHPYPTTQAWNSDQTLIMCPFTNPMAFHDGTTGAFVKTIDRDSIGYQVQWANVTSFGIAAPDLLFGTLTGNNVLRAWRVSTDTLVNDKSFAGYSEVSLGDGEGSLSNNDRYVALLGITGGVQKVMLYDRTLDSVTANMTVTTRPDNCSVSQSGAYTRITWGGSGTGNEQGVWICQADGVGGWTRLWQATPDGGIHADWGYDTLGNEVLVLLGAALPQIRMVRASTGGITQLAPDYYWSPCFGHVSCRNIDYPGWAVFSDSPYNAARPLGRDQIIAIKLDGSQTMKTWGRLGNHNPSNETNLDTGAHYSWSPMGCPSRDMKRILFASVWGGSTVHTFIASV